jgi:hypothetical protein
MPIPPYEGRRIYFFFADVEPKELMTFGVEAGIPLDDDSTLEARSPRRSGSSARRGPARSGCRDRWSSA